ncbi:hypothetical protein JTE90_029183 [Oedothorax gibbosus]|uniref:PH domain-containing protein n=1 Tax=Oedothorax gibbosus TaxID=931172 RepID=A0AAV6VDX5_9ARAC|nr:hypothetical protein JTE90_029183 [Oedothorax gibbosus]
MSNVSSSVDQGRDVEHVESLLEKYEAFRNRLCGHESAIEALKERGNSLIEEGHSESENAEDMLKDLEVTWLKSKESAQSRYKALEKEKSVYAFYKSVDETVSWIYEKDVDLSSEDISNDLESIKTLLRHHDTLEGDLKAIEEQVQALKEESVTLTNQFPDSQEAIDAKYQTVASSWEQCIEKAANRKHKLLQAEEIQSYFDEARDFQDWIYEMSALLNNHEIPEDVATCEALLAQFEGYKSEIDSRFRSFYNFEARGQEIIGNGHFMAQDVQSKLKELSDSLKELLQNWEDKHASYEQTLDLQLFKKKLLELEIWLNTQEHNLGGENGRTVEEVEYLIQKHEQFQKKIELYEVKFQGLLETTKFEEEMRQKKEEEERKRIEEEKLLKQQKLDEIRRKEEERLLQERRVERTETDLSHRSDYDDDYLEPKALNRFLREGSKMSYHREKRVKERSESPIVPPEIPVKEPPPTRAEGFLARKHELESGGKRSTSRQWKNLYTVMCGQLLCFFKDKKTFLSNNSSKPPVNILKAHCYIPKDYHKKKYVFRLELSDRSTFLFEAPNDIKREEWMQKINFTANLPPSKQLMSVAEESQFKERAQEKTVEPTTLNIGTVSELYAIPNERLNETTEEDHRSNVSSETSPNLSSTAIYDKPRDSDARSRLSSDSSQNFYSTTVYDKPQFTDSYVNYGKTYNDFYDDPFESTSGTSFSIPSNVTDDTNPASNRSSLSNQSSYVTAAASNSSLSTLQDDRFRDVASDDEYANADSTPRGSNAIPPPEDIPMWNTTPRSSFSEIQQSSHKKVEKCSTMPEPITWEKVKKKPQKPSFFKRLRSRKN